jgi:phenylacetate-CoA ligase
MASFPATRGWRERAARILWHAHPARPGPELALLRESQWWPRERLEELQALGLRRLVEAAIRVPFHRERLAAAGVGPADIRTVADLARLPVLERAEVERLGVRGMKVPGSFGVRMRSSGSLGRPVEFLWPLPQMRWLDAGEARARGWLGWSVGERSLEVRCRPVGRPQAISAALLNAEALHAPSVVDDAVVDRITRALERRPPTLVWGVSNALYVVALALLANGRTIRAKAVWSGGNHLHPHYRRALEQAFLATVYERYATMETGLVAHECPEGRSLHVPAEGVLAEIVRPDGSPAATGETGDVLLTSLRNRATPLLRYRVGDRATVPEQDACSCGRVLPVFGAVAGRSQDVLLTASGQAVGPRQVVEAMRPAMDGIVDFQAIQDGMGRLRILVVQRDSPAPETERARIAAIFEAVVQPPEPPRVERVDRIALTPGGKLRTLISECRDEPVSPAR